MQSISTLIEINGDCALALRFDHATIKFKSLLSQPDIYDQ